MEKKWNIFLLLVSFSAMPSCAFAAVDYVNNNTEDYMVFNNTVIADSVVVDNLNVVNSAVITNNGVINGNIDVCKGCDLYIKNAGIINAEFGLPETSNIIQLIQNNSDINPIGANDFSVLVENADKVSWFGIQNISAGADKIILHNSGLELTGNRPRVANAIKVPDIELHGDVTIYLDENFVIPDSPILTNISGDGVVRIEAESNNSLYRFHSYILDNSLYVDVVRDTDYFKILKNDTGKFLNYLRVENPNDKLLSSLDNAASIAEINEIISASVRLNPINLMNSVRIFDAFILNEKEISEDMFSIAPLGVFGDSFSAFGMRLNAAFELINDLNFGLNIYTASFNNSDKYENYKSAVYGGNVHIAYFKDDVFIKGKVGGTIANFDIENIFVDGKIVEYPSGFSFYSSADFGHKLDLKSNFIIAPFVRAVYDGAKIVNTSIGDLYAGVGADIVFEEKDYDFSYKYSANLVVYTNQQIDAYVDIDVRSLADRAGGSFSVGIVRMAEGSVGYKIKLSANFDF